MTCQIKRTIFSCKIYILSVGICSVLWKMWNITIIMIMYHLIFELEYIQIYKLFYYFLLILNEWVGYQSRREKVTKMWLTLIRNVRIKMNKSKVSEEKFPSKLSKFPVYQSHFLLCPQANQCQIFQKIHYWLEIFNLKLNLQDFIKKKTIICAYYWI